LVPLVGWLPVGEQRRLGAVLIADRWQVVGGTVRVAHRGRDGGGHPDRRRRGAGGHRPCRAGPGTPAGAGRGLDRGARGWRLLHGWLGARRRWRVVVIVV